MPRNVSLPSPTSCLRAFVPPCLLLFAALSLGANKTPTTRHAVEPADNSYCLTCHINFQEEKLAAQHQKAGVACSSCHGPSDKHSSDEDGLTAPDIIFAKELIQPTCVACHKNGALEKDAAHAPLLAGKSVEPYRFCTDCHGKHAMAHRTRRWDKNTRKLVSDDGVRMMNQVKEK
ncbi:MAG: cytochrome c3 family protein [Tepidisphaerales bacterium]